MKITILLFVCSIFCAAAVQAEKTPAQLYKQTLENNQAVQTWYVNGVPHTDKNGSILTKYDPEKSFFPIGMWGIPLHDPAAGYNWQELQDLGCNTVWPYGGARIGKTALEQAEKFNFQLIFMGRNLSDAALNTIANHPRLLGHVFYDEPIGQLGKPGVMEKLYADFTAFKERYRKVSPSTVVFINDAPWIMPPATEWFVKWNTSGDVACHDNYPIKKSGGVPGISEAPNGLMQSTVLTTLANKEQKPVWIILGTFELGFLEGRDAFPARFPTADQLRSQVYSAIIHGATGIHYFIWDSFISRDGCVFGISPDPQVKPGKYIESSPRSRPASPMQLVNAKMLWEATVAINKELKELIPVILSPTVDPAQMSYAINSFPVERRSVSPQPVHGMLKKIPGEDAYILLNANMDAEIMDTTFTFDRELADVKVLFGTYPMPVKISADGRKFTLRYEAFQAHILKLTFKKDSKIIPVTTRTGDITNVELPLDKARLWAVGKSTAKLYHNPVCRESVIRQPVVKGEEPWSIQWSKLLYPGIERGKSYDLYVLVKPEGDKGAGVLFNVGCWNSKAKRNIFFKGVAIKQMLPGKFGWVNVGKLNVSDDPANLAVYIAPDKAGIADAYEIKAVELRLAGGSAAATKAAASDFAFSAALPLAKAALWSAPGATPKRQTDEGAAVIRQPLAKGKDGWYVQWNRISYLKLEKGKKYDLYLQLKVENPANPSGTLFTAGCWNSKAKRSVFQKKIKANQLKTDQYLWINAGQLEISDDPHNLSIYLAPDKAGDAAEAYLIKAVELRSGGTVSAGTPTVPVKKKLNVKGKVFNDLNGNSKLDAGEAGIPGIQISDGLNIVVTDGNGDYTINNADGKFIFAVKPDHGVFTGKHYANIAPQVDFGIKFATPEKRAVFFSVNDSECGNADSFIGDVAKAVKEKKGDFLVHCGDIGNMPGHLTSMTAAGVPVHYAIGNHDFKNKGGCGEAEFEKSFGPVYYSFNHGGLHFIILAHLTELDAPPSDDLWSRQLKWLKQDLILNPGPKVLFRHHPLRITDETTELLLKTEHKLLAAVAGHTHQTQARNVNGVISIESAPPHCGGIDHTAKGFICGIWENGKLSFQKITGSQSRSTVPVDPQAPGVRTAGNWQQFRKDSGRSGIAAQKLVLPLALKWKVQTPGRIFASSPIIADGKVFIAALDDEMAECAAVCAYDVTDGRLLWKSIVGASVKHTLAADGKRVYGACVDGTAFALDVRDGRKLWSRKIAYFDKSEGLYGAAMLHNGRLWVGGDHWAELDPENGNIIREDDKKNMGAGCYNSTVISGNVIYSSEHWRQGIYAHDLNSGKRLWRTGREKGVYTFLDAGVIHANGKLYQKVRTGLRILEAANGRCLAEYVFSPKRNNMETFSLPLVAGNRVFYGSAHGVFAHDASDAKLLWHFVPGKEMQVRIPYSRTFMPAVYASPAIAGNMLIFGAGDGLLYVIDSDSGKKLFSADLGAPVYSSPAISGNTVLTACADGVLFAFTGREQ